MHHANCWLAAACRPWSVGLVALGLSLGSAARAAGPPRAEISLPDAVRLALAQNPDSRSAEQDVAAAEGALSQAHELPNPSIFVYALGTAIDPAAAPIPNQFGFTWTLPFLTKRAAGIDVARSNEDAAVAARAATRRQLAFAVETAFIAVLRDQSILAFARDDATAFRQVLSINEVRYTDGKIAYGDVLKLRIQALQVDDTVRQATQQLAADRIELARLVGGGVLAPDFRALGTLQAPTALPDVTAEEVVEKALRLRPETRQYQAEIDSSNHARSLARQQIIPDIGILADYNRIPDTAGTYDLELILQVPLFNLNGGAIAQADAAYQKSNLAWLGMRDQITAQTRRAVSDWRISRQRLAAYTEDLVHMSEESLDISRHSYELGRGTLLDFLDAESRNRDVQRAYRSAQADAMLAAATLAYVSGEPLP